MQTGIYEQIVNLFLEKRLKSLPVDHIYLDTLDSADSHDYLAQYIHRVIKQGLAQVKPVPGLKTEAEKSASKIERQIDICNEIISVLQQTGDGTFEEEKISPEAKRLLAVLETARNLRHVRPDTPISLGALLTGTRQDPTFVSQLEKEIKTADQIDILCSFIKWSGIRILEPALRAFTEKEHSCLRIITTSYMGATDLKAIHFLAELPNTEIKVSYDTHRTRLHAKAYLIHRKTNFSTAYIGSANVSQAAMTDGLEWNIKISQYEQPYQWEKIAATFNTYWNDSEFETYSPKCDRDRLRLSLLKERSATNENDYVLPNFDLRPYGFQQEILDRIASERELQQRKKHLIVAATGTGKTMIAAFDFKRWRENFRLNRRQQSRLLFVAHREEILRQSLHTFRAVLRDYNFGSLFVGGIRPDQYDQLFISIQTYNSQNLASMVSAGHYDYVVIDEFHHAAAPSYQDLLDHIQPESLLGLTATPERTDGLNVKRYFDEHITAEIRLPDAINRKLLCPFQYFGISDTVDYSGLRWQRGGYIAAELEGKLTGNDERANMVIEKLVEKVLDIYRVRGLGFCVSQPHAEYMANKFNQAGIPSDFLISNSSREHRGTVQQRLLNREINFIFVVDLYNEGVDIPEVDTVMFLRPTESLTVYLQQLGRGLRLSDNKDCLTVLDFVGRSHKRFRHDIRLKALMADPNRRVKDDLEDGFPYLPAGCSIHLEKQAREYILENIKQSLVQSKSEVIQNISSFSSDTGLQLTLVSFLKHCRLGLDDIYRRTSWSRLCAEAGVREGFVDADESLITKGLRRLQHVNDVNYIDTVLRVLKGLEIDLSEKDYIRMMMFCVTLWGPREVLPTIEENIARIHRNPTMRDEIIYLLNLCREEIQSIPPLQRFNFSLPLEIHAKYSRDEILIALGYWDLQNKPPVQAGVIYLEDKKTDAYFVTLNKSHKHYSPTTMYEDYAISDRLFHWQSQSTTSEESPTGQRYINHKSTGNTILLFVREDRQNQNYLTEPYHFLGAADYVTHQGSRPISITWKLRSPMPAYLQRQTSRLAII